MSIEGQGHSLTLVKGHSDFRVKCLTFGLYTQVSDSGPLGPLVVCVWGGGGGGRGEVSDAVCTLQWIILTPRHSTNLQLVRSLVKYIYYFSVLRFFLCE